MQRREFIMHLGGAAAAWPLAARAQQPSRMKRIGILMSISENDPSGQARVAALLQSLQQLGWFVGGSMQVDFRWGAGDIKRIQEYAAELVALAPDVLVANGSVSLVPLLAVTRTVPIVFAIVPDPVGAGFVDSMARPGGNATGFISFEYSMAVKWLELLKQIAPWVTRVAVIRDPAISAGAGQFGAIQSVAPSFGVELTAISARDAPEIERALAVFAHSSNGGLVASQSALTAVHGDLIVSLAAQHKLPGVYFQSSFVDRGGLISYGPDFVDEFRRAAGYVDRILKGGKPADLPIQTPTKYQLVINLKTAKVLGLTIPPTLLARADKVIE